MKAAQLIDYGPAENLRISEVETPQPGEGEALVKIAYAGLRWGDIMGRRGVPMRIFTPPFVPGQEAVGVVADLGPNTSKFEVGDRVVATPLSGAYGEYLALPENSLTVVPESMPLESMLVYRVNMPAAYLIVHEWAEVRDGETVLVHAAAGGVGSLIVQILKRTLADVTVIGLAGTDDKVAAVLANGADHAINYKTTDYVDAVGEIAGAKAAGFNPLAAPAGVHVALNGVGGPTLDTDRKVIRKLGRWVIYGNVAGNHPIELQQYAYDSITIKPFSLIPFFGTPQMERAGRFLDNWLANEPLLVPSIHPIEDIVAVQQAMERGETTGKVVFKF